MHQYAYHFKGTKRSSRHNSGLDYTKMLIINDMNFIDAEPGIVDKDEYVETVKHIVRIKEEATAFLKDYINHVTGEKLLNEKEFSRRYRFCPLKYFHNELGITDTY